MDELRQSAKYYIGVLTAATTGLRAAGAPDLAATAARTAVLALILTGPTTMRRLKSLGVHVAIDDFGTGSSSLSCLRRFPVDSLKIDKSFIDGLGRHPEDTTIVQAVISLAHALGLGLVAEGVESVEQLRHPRACGCELAQGYCFSRPLSREDADELLVGIERDSAAVGLRSLLAAPPVGLVAEAIVYDD